jgi:hypothetical protein
MTTELFTPENTSTESILAAFDAALFETKLSDLGHPVILDKYLVIVSVENNSLIRLHSYVNLKDDYADDNAHALCNRINAGLIIIRASVEDAYLVLDWYLPLRGGISKKAVIRALRHFNELIDSVYEHDIDKLIC